jgi:hypothetical protein
MDTQDLDSATKLEDGAINAFSHSSTCGFDCGNVGLGIGGLTICWMNHKKKDKEMWRHTC